MKFERIAAIPAKDTFDCAPIGAFVKRYLARSKVSVDCFARNKQWATYTNDLNPATTATYHLDVRDFLQLLVEQGVQADCVIFDPPYSPTQLKRSYDDIGKKMNGQDAWRTGGWSAEKRLVHQLLVVGGVYLQFGWHSGGMQSAMKGWYEIEEITLVYHGGAHLDTICMAERKVDQQLNLF